MVVVSLLRYGRTISSSFWNMLIGAVLFVSSDSVLALSKFAGFTSKEWGLIIMGTYYLA